MTSRIGWTFNGKHFAETRTTRLSSPRIMFFIDGKPVPEREWRAEMVKARKAEAAAQAA